MRILLSSHVFSPSIGGIETASLLFAKRFAARGHDVTVVTATPGTGEFPFHVVRRSDARTLLNLVRASQVVWHSNISLRALWPLALVGRPLLVTHHVWLGPHSVSGRALALLKKAASAMGENVFVSQALKKAAGLPGEVIPNAYDDSVFRVLPDVAKDRDIAFVGRLVPGKGADVLIDAMRILAGRGVRAGASVIGSGPKAEKLKAQAISAGLGQAVSFLGPLDQPTLARELNRHRILAVPSHWGEPFGIVALEGAACGCVPVGTDDGGLPEAIGPCGPIVRKRDPGALADALEKLLANPEAMAGYRRAAGAHLVNYRSATIVDAYEGILRRLVN